MSFILPALTTLAGLYGNYKSGQNQPQAPEYTPYKSPYEGALRQQVNQGLSGQLTPVQAQLFQQALERGKKSIAETVPQQAAGGYARQIAKFTADMALNQSQVGEQNRQQAVSQAMGIDQQAMQQQKMQFDTQIAEYLRQLQQSQGTQDIFGGVAGMGLEALLKQSGVNAATNQANPSAYGTQPGNVVDSTTENIKYLFG